MFCLSENKVSEDREHKTHFPHFLWAITQIKLGELGFFFEMQAEMVLKQSKEIVRNGSLLLFL